MKRGSFDVGIAVHWLDGIADAATAWALTPRGASTLALLGFTVKDAAVLGGKGVIQVELRLRIYDVAATRVRYGYFRICTCCDGRAGS
ncbi:MAG: hypothetical protein A4S16_12815 [Proteobacteria bacterium SG_bin6]|nr:MAG: hypothetical protein A4S16_12815 [Proteobacteria bacterium SG_bin6]